MPTGIDIADVSKRFGTVDAVAPTSLTIRPGEVVTLLGPSGCGKTTMLRMIAGLEAPTAGSITIDERPPEQARRSKQIGLVPQQPGLLPWRTVGANARLLLELNRRRGRQFDTPDDADRAADRTGELLRQVGLGDFVEALPHELSGGMQQRVALVRAFALGAPYLLLDEPFAALDEMTRADMRHLLAELCEPRQTTVVFVTHSIAEAVFLSDRVAVMSSRPGRVVGQVEIGLARPRRAEVENTAEFFEYETTVRSLLSGGRTNNGERGEPHS